MAEFLTPRARKMLIQDSNRFLASTTTMGVPDSIQAAIKVRYPNIQIRLSPREGRFKVFEWFPIGAVSGVRHLWDYENPDSSQGPLLLKVLLDWLWEADTRNWPMPERVKCYLDEHKAKTAAVDKAHKDLREAITLEDYDYIAGIKTFFMDPKSMPQRVSTSTPYQERALAMAGA